MKPLMLAALLAALWTPAQAQDDTWDLEKYNEPKQVKPVKDRDVRKAERLAKKDEDFPSLDKKEQDIVIMAIAQKLAALRRKKGIQWVDSVEINIKVSDTDLKTLEKKYPGPFKISRNVSVKENIDVIPGKSSWEPSFEDVTGEPVRNLFADNQWKVLADSEDAAALRKLVDDLLAGMGPNDRVTGLHVKASASTLRCTAVEDGKPINNLRLSELRALAAKEFVKEHLKSKHGIDLPEEVISIDFIGENKNGTSGPDDFYGTGDKGNGPPYKDLTEYAQHRYVRTTLSVYRDHGKPVTDPDTQVCKARVVSMDADTDSWKLNIKLPRIKWPRLHIGAFFKRLFRGKKGALPCPEW